MAEPEAASVATSNGAGAATPAAGTGGHAAPTSPSDKDSASKTFYTSIDTEAPTRSTKNKEDRKERYKFKTLESTNAGPRIMEHHTDLKTLAMELDKRMGGLLAEHEKDFFLAYKTHMYSVQKEIKTLRMKADHEEAKTREDTKIKALEGELDWFMTEAIRLDELCRDYKRKVDKWKSKAEALDEDRRFLEDQIKGAKRQNKILRSAAERARSSAYSALMVTRARTEGDERDNNGASMPAPQSQSFLTDVNTRPASAGGGMSAVRGGGIRAIANGRAPSPEPQHHMMQQQKQLALTGGSHSESMRRDPSAGAMPAGGAAMQARNVLGNEAEERYVEAIQHLKESIIKEQHNVRMLQAARATQYAHKSEMEEFFLKCIDGARKELQRTQHINMHKEKNERERVLEAMLNNEDVLVCLYEKLFPHRTGIARSLGGNDDEIPRVALPTPGGY